MPTGIIPNSFSNVQCQLLHHVRLRKVRLNISMRANVSQYHIEVYDIITHLIHSSICLC